MSIEPSVFMDCCYGLNFNFLEALRLFLKIITSTQVLLMCLSMDIGVLFQLLLLFANPFTHIYSYMDAKLYYYLFVVDSNTFFVLVVQYTRTPSREPHMIRPLPVLQMTMDHLLGLINRDYGEELLSIHSFLWDRMRAVRMDLRMQHIFNREAITMHEQMVNIF